MKFLVALSCVFALATAGHIVPHGVLVQPQHLPVIGPNGVPLEPAENVAARVAHANAHIEAKARNGDLSVVAPIATPVISSYAAPVVSSYAAPVVSAYSAPVVSTYAAPAVAAPIAYSGLAYAGPQHLPVIGPNGVPLEPAANVAARVEHANAHIEAKARNGDVDIIAPVAPVVSAYSPVVSTYAAQHLPVIGANGVPVEPLENVAARAAHAAAHIEAKVRNGDAAVVYSRKRRGLAYVAAPQHLPVIGPNGVPLEPAANVAARAAHAAAHVEAQVRNGDAAVAYTTPLAYHTAAYAPSIAYTAAVHPSQTYPALNIDGQPLETPEVVAAKSAHFAAHAEARARTFGAAYYAAPYTTYAATPLAYTAPVAHITHSGVPLDTPEVAAAKAAHFAAHAAVASHVY